MTKRFLITRPMHDVNTTYLHDFCCDTLKAAKSTKEIHVTDLEGREATRANLTHAISTESPGLVFLNGHGDKDKVCGHKDEVILDNQNILLAKDRIMYALACNSLESLGPLAVDNGARAYVGYKAPFMFVHDPTRESCTLKDSCALPFRRACEAMIGSLVFGRTVGESIDETKKEYIRSIRSYGDSSADPYGDTPLIRFALAWDYEFLGAEGDHSARFV